MLSILKIEIDGHFHGSSDVPRPWVAEITGTCPRYGLQRQFIDVMNDWKDAKRAWSGNIYGRVAHFPLRDGRLYEVSRLRGRSSKRHQVREFIAVDGGKQLPIEPEAALARVDGGGSALVHSTADSIVDGSHPVGSWIAHITALGTPAQLGWVVVGGMRHYRLRPGIHEIVRDGERHFVRASDESISSITEREALTWLLENAR